MTCPEGSGVRVPALRARVLLGLCRSDMLEGCGQPMVVGCISEAIWDHCDQETTDGMWAEMKSRVDPGGDYYEYREVIVSLDGETARWIFDTPYVPGQIEAPDA